MAGCHFCVKEQPDLWGDGGKSEEGAGTERKLADTQPSRIDSRQ